MTHACHRIRLLLIVLPLAAAGCAGPAWRPDLGGALRLAARDNRVVVVAYWSDFDADCRRMDSEVFTNSKVRATLQTTIPVRLSAALNRSFAEQHGLTGVPAFVVFAPDGRVLRKTQGYLNEGRFRGFVEAARLSL
jgi:hypothetical protein